MLGWRDPGPPDKHRVVGWTTLRSTCVMMSLLLTDRVAVCCMFFIAVPSHVLSRALPLVGWRLLALLHKLAHDLKCIGAVDKEATDPLRLCQITKEVWAFPMLYLTFSSSRVTPLGPYLLSSWGLDPPTNASCWASKQGSMRCRRAPYGNGYCVCTR